MLKARCLSSFENSRQFVFALFQRVERKLLLLLMTVFLLQGLKNFAEVLFESNDTEGTTTGKPIFMRKVNDKSRPVLSRFDEFAMQSCSLYFLRILSIHA